MPRNRRLVVGQTLPPVNDREQLTFESDTTNDSACFEPKLTYRKRSNPQTVYRTRVVDQSRWHVGFCVRGDLQQYVRTRGFRKSEIQDTVWRKTFVTATRDLETRFGTARPRDACGALQCAVQQLRSDESASTNAGPML